MTPRNELLRSTGTAGGAAQRAPTEAEIREAIAEPIRKAVGGLVELLGDSLDPILDSEQALTRRGWAENFYPRDGHPGTLWADLTEAEASELSQLIDDAFDAGRIEELIVSEVVLSALEFARRHPDVPRGTWSPAKPQLIEA